MDGVPWYAWLLGVFTLRPVEAFLVLAVLVLVLTLAFRAVSRRRRLR